MFYSQYTLMSACTRSVDPAFHVREMGSSLGTAPALQNRLPPSGSDTAPVACVCASQFGTSASLHIQWSAHSQEKCPSYWVLLQWEEKAVGFPAWGTPVVSSCKLNGVAFTPNSICSTRAEEGFEFSQCYPELLCSHLNWFLISVNPEGTAVSICFNL